MVNLKRIKRIGFGIIVFDDVCHLRNITSEIRDIVDDITICLQPESYYGLPISQSVIDHVNGLVKEGLVDHVVMFNVVDYHSDKGADAPRHIETDKRNFLLDCMEKNGCSHTMVTDSDEFYDHDDFEEAVRVIDEHPEIRISYCEYVNYYRDYRHVMVWPFKCYVPFLTESRFRFCYEYGNFDRPSDPTRRYKIDVPDLKYCILSYKTVKMHHLSWIRKNIEDKIDNWSSKLYFDKIPGLREQILDSYYNYKDGNNVTIMFNTPFYHVAVNTLPDQYIKPKHSFIEDL